MKYMSRPKLYEEKRVTTAVRLPEHLHQRLQETAAERDVSVNYLVGKAIDFYLDQLIPVDQAVIARPA
jgi:predicted HicB family RNase H-like nuclease